MQFVIIRPRRSEVILKVINVHFHLGPPTFIWGLGPGLGSGLGSWGKYKARVEVSDVDKPIALAGCQCFGNDVMAR